MSTVLAIIALPPTSAHGVASSGQTGGSWPADAAFCVPMGGQPEFPVAPGAVP
jgi:hypothetical protein